MNTYEQASQEYTQALDSEQQVRQSIASVSASILSTRQYQLDYEVDIRQLKDSLARVQQQATVERLTRTKQFMKQLKQMERDSMHKLYALETELYKATQTTQIKLDAIEPLIQLRRNL